MRKFISEGFSKLLIQDFNLCFFISLMLLSLYPDSQHFAPGHKFGFWFIYVLIPSFNGLFTAYIMYLLNNYFSRKNYTHPYYSADKAKLFAIAFSAGFLGLYITISPLATFLISLLIIHIAALNVRNFATQLSNLLEPDKTATIQDVGEFANFFINLIITFSAINLSINTVHVSFGLPQAFNFGEGFSAIVNSLYFSIITMTTVGYGHIIPATLLARFVVALECLTSYVMLGIMIGIITRGINLSKK